MVYDIYYKIIHKIHEENNYKTPMAGHTPTLSVHLLTCINLCSHVTNYMIIATHTDRVSLDTIKTITTRNNKEFPNYNPC